MAFRRHDYDGGGGGGRGAGGGGGFAGEPRGYSSPPLRTELAGSERGAPPRSAFTQPRRDGYEERGARPPMGGGGGLRGGGGKYEDEGRSRFDNDAGREGARGEGAPAPLGRSTASAFSGPSSGGRGAPPDRGEDSYDDRRGGMGGGGGGRDQFSRASAAYGSQPPLERPPIGGGGAPNNYDEYERGPRGGEHSGPHPVYDRNLRGSGPPPGEDFPRRGPAAAAAPPPARQPQYSSDGFGGRQTVVPSNDRSDNGRDGGYGGKSGGYDRDEFAEFTPRGDSGRYPARGGARGRYDAGEPVRGGVSRGYDRDEGSRGSFAGSGARGGPARGFNGDDEDDSRGDSGAARGARHGFGGPGRNRFEGPGGDEEANYNGSSSFGQRKTFERSQDEDGSGFRGRGGQSDYGGRASGGVSRGYDRDEGSRGSFAGSGARGGPARGFNRDDEDDRQGGNHYVRGDSGGARGARNGFGGQGRTGGNRFEGPGEDEEANYNGSSSFGQRKTFERSQDEDGSGFRGRGGQSDYGGRGRGGYGNDSGFRRFDDDRRDGFRGRGGREGGFRGGGEDRFNGRRNDGGDWGGSSFSRGGVRGGGYGEQSAPRDYDEKNAHGQLKFAPRGYVTEHVTIEQLIQRDVDTSLKADFSVDVELQMTGRGANDIDIRQDWDSIECLDRDLIDFCVNRLKYKILRPIQMNVIPAVCAGHDVVGQAETGSGKSAAFLLPIIDYILKNPTMDQHGKPIALILVPTREVCQQIYDQARKFSYPFADRVKVARAHGEYCRPKNVADLMKGCDILVATLGRCEDLMDSRDLRMDELRFLVIDEADRMLEERKGFCELDFLRLDKFFPRPEDRQTLLFSTTFPDVQTFAEGWLRKDFLTIVPKSNRGGANVRIKQNFIKASGRPEKFEKLKEIILKEQNETGSVRKTLVFANTTEDTYYISIDISKTGVRCQDINGDRGQNDRDAAIQEFRDGKTKVLVGTDLCERGLDISELEHVINFDMPDNPNRYVHRIGRTGRVTKGEATSFIDETHERSMANLSKFIDIVRNSNQVVPEWMEELASRSGSGGGSFGKGIGGGAFGSRFSGGGGSFGDRASASASTGVSFGGGGSGISFGKKPSFNPISAPSEERDDEQEKNGAKEEGGFASPGFKEPDNGEDDLSSDYTMVPSENGENTAAASPDARQEVDEDDW